MNVKTYRQPFVSHPTLDGVTLTLVSAALLSWCSQRVNRSHRQKDAKQQNGCRIL